ncbi:type II/IV secretion system protein [Candidatus Uhrbacteria bacterium]|jgi:type IV pilus assembly protein PilB|nr:type II/IV secretion system protein [Candidatus Uhrbacteria bacterium]MBT7717365.1 type II/IV secretion system protein [Candidatus Uhrbacteria bacterium]
MFSKKEDSKKTNDAVGSKKNVPIIGTSDLEKMIKAAGTKTARETLVIEFMDALMLYANQNRASDVHLEPKREGMAIVRLRVDGMLRDEFEIPYSLHSQSVARLKIMTNMRSDEHRAPQDGRFSFKTQVETVDVRASIIATVYGEKVVLRLLSGATHGLTLEDLGFSETDLQRLRAQIKKPWGMILATGPTGSGKTTSIYAVLEELNRREVNISTIEDPVEFKLGDVNQSQVDRPAEFTFATGLRSLLRQDPDIIMVGEIRDKETAKIAVNAALTGHKMLSTLHTNDAPTTIPRLMDMGVEPYLVASTFNCAVGQRLMRRVCEKCAKEISLTKAEAVKKLPEATVKLVFKDKDSIEIMEAVGCEACGKSGYHGRIGIYEVLVNTLEMQSLIAQRAESTVIREKAIQQGMTTMEEDGARKLLQKVSTLDEFMRVLHE